MRSNKIVFGTWFIVANVKNLKTGKIQIMLGMKKTESVLHLSANFKIRRVNSQYVFVTVKCVKEHNFD